MAGNQKDTTGALILAIIGIIYGVSPIDIIPDVIPVIGWGDDLLITGGTVVNYLAKKYL